MADKQVRRRLASILVANVAGSVEVALGHANRRMSVALHSGVAGVGL